jgi:hypothetical protein
MITFFSLFSIWDRFVQIVLLFLEFVHLLFNSFIVLSYHSLSQSSSYTDGKSPLLLAIGGFSW